MNPPTAKVIITPNNTGTPATDNAINIIPAKAKTEPTDRSICAAVMTKVIPKAIMAVIDTCVKIFIILLGFFLITSVIIFTFRSRAEVPRYWRP